MTLMNKLYCSKCEPKPSQHFLILYPNKKPGNSGSFTLYHSYMNSIVKAAFYFKFV